MKGKWGGSSSSSSSSTGVAKWFWFWFFYTKNCCNTWQLLMHFMLPPSKCRSPRLLPSCFVGIHSFLELLLLWHLHTQHPLPLFPSPPIALPSQLCPISQTQTAKPEWRRIKICHSWQQPISSNLEEPHQPTFSHTTNQLLRKLPDWREPKTPILLLLLFSPLRSLSFGIIQKLCSFSTQF